MPLDPGDFLKQLVDQAGTSLDTTQRINSNTTGLHVDSLLKDIANQNAVRAATVGHDRTKALQSQQEFADAKKQRLMDVASGQRNTQTGLDKILDRALSLGLITTPGATSGSGALSGKATTDQIGNLSRSLGTARDAKSIADLYSGGQRPKLQPGDTASQGAQRPILPFVKPKSGGINVNSPLVTNTTGVENKDTKGGSRTVTGMGLPDASGVAKHVPGKVLEIREEQRTGAERKTSEKQQIKGTQDQLEHNPFPLSAPSGKPLGVNLDELLQNAKLESGQPPENAMIPAIFGEKFEVYEETVDFVKGKLYWRDAYGVINIKDMTIPVPKVTKKTP